MKEKDYLRDISEIKNMMSKSSQFISLSGLSGILAGIYALVGAWLANNILTQFPNTDAYDQINSENISDNEIVRSLVAIALTVIVLSLFSGILLSSLKAKKAGEKLWNATSRRLLVNFAIPLATGGIFTLLLLQKEYYNLVAASTLLFYGLGCVNASKNTFRDVRYLGLTIIILGLIAAAFSGYSLLLWAIGFGFCHIFYGAIMYFKYDRK